MSSRSTHEIFPRVVALVFAVVAMPVVHPYLNAQAPAERVITLNEAIDLALKQNRNLELARLNIIDSQQKKTIAKSAYFPQIKNESSILHITALQRIEIPVGALGVPSATGPLPSQNVYLGQGDLTSYTSGTGLAQPLTQLFKIHEANRAATADIRNAQFQAKGAENEITLKVREVYYGILIALLQEQAAKDQLDASEVKQQESAADVQRGNALEVTSLESQAAFLEAKQALLIEELTIHDLQLSLKDLLGLPLDTNLALNDSGLEFVAPIPARAECIDIAKRQNPDIQAARQTLEKARAGVAAAKDAYIPDLTALARYSYQSGLPFFLVHNFGTFGFTVSYDLFDGGRRNASVHESETTLAQARLHLAQLDDEVEIQVQTAYDKVERTRSMVAVADQVTVLRAEAARLADRQFEENAALASQRAQAHALAAVAKASQLEANLGLLLAQGDLLRTIGLTPR